jgi:hypothetical protein
VNVNEAAVIDSAGYDSGSIAGSYGAIRSRLDRPGDDLPVGVAVPGDVGCVVSGTAQGLLNLARVAALILVSGGD